MYSNINARASKQGMH
jgi:hypothetical protein